MSNSFVWTVCTILTHNDVSAWESGITWENHVYMWRQINKDFSMKLFFHQGFIFVRSQDIPSFDWIFFSFIFNLFILTKLTRNFYVTVCVNYVSFDGMDVHHFIIFISVTRVLCEYLLALLQVQAYVCYYFCLFIMQSVESITVIVVIITTLIAGDISIIAFTRFVILKMAGNGNMTHFDSTV